MTPAGRPRGRSAAAAALLAALVGSGVSGLAPGGLSTAQAMPLVNALAAAAVLVGLTRARPRTRRVWRLLLAGQVLNAAGWALWLVLPALTGAPLGAPNAGDAVFLLAYALVLAGVTGMARAAGAGRDALLDAAVLGVSGGVLIWATIGSPQAEGAGGTLAARAVGLAYPVLDVLLLAAALPLVLGAARGARASLLVGFACLQLVGDLLYSWQVVAGVSHLDGLVHACYVAAYAALAAAALHPARVRRADPPGWCRPALLCVGVLPLPGLLVVRVLQGSSRQVALVAVASLVVTLLAVLRAARSGPVLPPSAERALRRGLARWTAALVVLALLPLVAVTALAVSQARVTMEADLVERLQGAAATSAQHTADQLSVLQDLVSSYADRQTLVRAVRQGPAGETVVQRHLAELERRSPSFVGVWFVDPRGVVRHFSHSHQDLVGRSVADEDYVRAVLDYRAPYVSDAFRPDLPGGPRLVAVAAPVRDGGRLAGVLVLGHRLEPLDRAVQDLGRQARARLTLTDRDRVVLAGPALQTTDAWVRDDRRGVRRALEGRSGLLRGDRDGGAGPWTAYTTVPGTGWAVVAEVAAGEAAAPAERFTGRVVGAAALLGQLLLVGLLLQVGAERRRRAAEALLAAREEQVREVLQAAGDAFVSVDGDGRVVEWNARAEALYGWAPEQVLGRPLRELVVAQEDHRALDALLAALPQDGRGTVLEVTHVRRDGTRFPAEVTTWTTRGSRGPVHNAFVRDLTLRKEHEAALAAARDAALHASRLKSQFVANMSHEIRTPLNGVVGMTTLLQATPLDARQLDYLRTLAGSADALLRVLNDVLDLSKIEAGKLDVEPGDVDVAELVLDVAELFSAAAQVKGLVVDVALDPLVPGTVRTDGHRLRQVLTNLTSNAVKFTARGRVLLEVAVDGPEHEGGVPLVLRVRDTGPGIPADQQGRLFEAFAQADSSTTRAHGGTGLGLTISRSLVGLLGGELRLHSAPGEGSTFAVHLVLPRGAAPAEPALPAPRDGAADGVAPRGRLLVAEDSAVNQLVVVEMLRLVGFEADVADDGAQAVAMLVERPYDLVLMDCQMPVLDGFEATARIRALPAPRCATPVVALTASALNEDRAECLDAGMDDFLAKPLRLDELERVLERVLGAVPARV